MVSELIKTKKLCGVTNYGGWVRYTYLLWDLSHKYFNPSKNMYEILSQEKNVPISEMVAPPPYNATISFEMPILEENMI
jgi:hypothetical protein